MNFRILTVEWNEEKEEWKTLSEIVEKIFDDEEFMLDWYLANLAEQHELKAVVSSDVKKRHGAINQYYFQKILKK